MSGGTFADCVQFGIFLFPRPLFAGLRWRTKDIAMWKGILPTRNLIQFPRNASHGLDILGQCRVRGVIGGGFDASAPASG